MKRIHIFTIAAVLTLNFTISLPAQSLLDPDPGGTGGALWGTSDPAPTEDLSGEPGPPQPSDVPVDGGLSLLLAAGAAYGVRKVRRRPAGGS